MLLVKPVVVVLLGCIASAFRDYAAQSDDTAREQIFRFQTGDSHVAALVHQIGARSDQALLPQIMAAYNVATSVMYAVKAVEEGRFHSQGFQAEVAAGTEVAQSHITAMTAAANGEHELRADGWLALKALEKLLARVVTACEYEHKGSWIQRGLWMAGGVIGHAKEKDSTFASAVSTLQAEHTAISETITALIVTSICPMLLQTTHQQILAANLAAESFARATGKSLYLKMAQIQWVYQDPTEMSYTHPYTYAAILDEDCFVIDNSGAMRNHLHEDSQNEMIVEFTKIFDQASVFLGELISTCPHDLTQLPSESNHVAMCVPSLRDALLRAQTMNFAASLLGKLAPVKQWLATSAMAINTIFDSSSLLMLLQAGTQVSTGWFSSLAWLGYRAALHVPIRDECLSAAGNLTTVTGN